MQDVEYTDIKYTECKSQSPGVTSSHGPEKQHQEGKMQLPKDWETAAMRYLQVRVRDQGPVVFGKSVHDHGWGTRYLICQWRMHLDKELKEIVKEGIT